MFTYDIAIIGAGPAGMMAAIRASELGKKTIILERNDSAGKKLLISGKGRCNLTNSAQLEEFLTHFGKNGPFLRDAFKKFFNSELISFFALKGLTTKVERGNRIFPLDDKAGSVLEVLKKYLSQLEIELIFKARVNKIHNSKTEPFEISLFDGNIIKASRVILATGGASYPLTGSSGDGFRIAKDLGHTIIDLKPGLIPFEVKEPWVRGLAGLALKNVVIKAIQGAKSVESDVGEMLFTHWGVSGPLVLDLSNKILDMLENKTEIILSIDFKPGMTREELENRLLRDFKAQGAKDFKNILPNLLPKSLIDIFVGLSKIEKKKKANQLSKEERLVLLNLLKSFRLTITKPRPLAEAIVTRGGISLKEIDPKSMQSRLVKGMYFAGEIMDIDADTGGFNLQAAFSTGYLAGESAANSL